MYKIEEKMDVILISTSTTVHDMQKNKIIVRYCCNCKQIILGTERTKFRARKYKIGTDKLFHFSVYIFFFRARIFVALVPRVQTDS